MGAIGRKAARRSSRGKPWAAGRVCGGRAARLAHWRLPVTPIDTTGTGDAFVGVLSVALDEGRALPYALHLASVTGGQTCLKPGAASAMPTRLEVNARLSDLPAAKPV
ncbi:MAG: hypothetical protein EXQ99_05615 [Alphaproteobacteria bacterium]|nr:hypothetical protein [Alphaproteobacteria bacterium]